MAGPGFSKGYTGAWTHLPGIDTGGGGGEGDIPPRHFLAISTDMAKESKYIVCASYFPSGPWLLCKHKYLMQWCPKLMPGKLVSLNKITFNKIVGVMN